MIKSPGTSTKQCGHLCYMKEMDSTRFPRRTLDY